MWGKVFIIPDSEVSDEARVKLKKMEEAKKKRVEKLVEDFRTGKLNFGK